MQEFLEYLRQGNRVAGGSDLRELMHRLAQEALQITAELNNRCHEPNEMRVLFSKLIGKPVPTTFTLFPPFYSECGKNIFIGENVFINCGCRFQDHGGIYIGDGTLIGSAVVYGDHQSRAKPSGAFRQPPRPDSYLEYRLDRLARHHFARRNHWR